MLEFQDRERMIDSIPEFIDLYKRRPISNNFGGMGFNHSWATWYVTRTLQPDLIVESGVFAGHSTWLFEASAPASSIMSFDIDLSKRKFISGKAKYFENDFIEHDWSQICLEKALFFLDDHQNHIERLKNCKWIGAKHIILEDNYPSNEGDFYSLKHALGHSGAPKLQMSSSHRGNAFRRFKDNYLERIISSLGSSQNRLVKANVFDSANLERNVRFCIEFPPVFLPDIHPEWKKPYYEIEETLEPLSRVIPVSDFDYSYNWFTYVELE